MLPTCDPGSRKKLSSENRPATHHRIENQTLQRTRRHDRRVERGLPIEVTQHVVLVDVVLKVVAVGRRDPQAGHAENVREHVQGGGYHRASGAPWKWR